MQRTTAKIYWLPAHIGISGIEEADRLAKAATNSNECEISRLPFTDFNQFFKKDALDRTKNDVKEQGRTKGKIYFEYFSDRALT